MAVGRTATLAGAVTALLVTGVGALGADQPAVVAQARPVAAAALPAPPAPPPVRKSAPNWAPVPTPTTTPTWTDAPAAPAASAARPVRLRIPAIGVDSRIADIGVAASGALVPPRATDVAGWFSAGPAPGDNGPALLAGHVDSYTGPGVFFRLTELRRGDQVVVARADHSSVTFVVDSARRVSKAAFPTELVYSPKPVAMLRLVTCGGAFDPAARSYRDNIIVNATIR